MKKIIILLFSVILTMSHVNAHIASDSCNFKFILWDSEEIGWSPDAGIVITVDGVDYGFLNLAWGTPSIEKIVALPSGEMQLFWTGMFRSRYHFEVYNASNELIYPSPEDLSGGLFFTYQNECPSEIECLPITDFEGVYIKEEKQVNLSWVAPVSADLTGFDIFRNDSLIINLSSSTLSYSDNTAELEDGDYKYCVIPVYPFECTLDDKCFETYISNVGIKDYQDNIMIYPNPATNMIHLSGDMILGVRIYNNIGQLIINKCNTNIIDVSKLTNGIYIVSIETSTGNIQKKIVIMK
jgi:hypothetical protein